MSAQAGCRARGGIHCWLSNEQAGRRTTRCSSRSWGKPWSFAADLGVGRLLEMMTSARLLSVFVLMVSAVAACREASETEHPSTQETQGKSAAVVAALTLESQPAKVGLQAVLDATDGDASLAACNALLDTPLRIVTTEAKPFPVIMA